MTANDNNQDWRKCRGVDFTKYKKVQMTRFGPIGYTEQGFEYLDPETAEERS